MKRYKYFVCFVIIVFNLLSIVIAESNIVSINEVLQVAVDNSPEILLYKNAVNEADLRFKDAVANPDRTKDYLDTYGRYKMLLSLPTLSEEEEQELFYLKMMFPERLTNDDIYQTRISGALRLGNSKYVLLLQKNKLQTVSNDLVLSTIEIYNGLLQTQDLIAIKSREISNLEQKYNEAKIKFSIGKISLSNLNLVQLEREKEKIAQKKLNMQLEKNRSILKKKMGDYSITKTAVYGDYTLDESLLESQDYYITQALENRLDLLATESNYENKKKSYEIAKEVYNDENNINCIEAQYDMETAQNNLEMMRINTQLAVINSYKAAEAVFVQVQSSKLNFDLVSSKYQEAKKNFELGLITSLELSEANVSLSEAKNTYISAKRSFEVAKKRLLSTCGINLNEIRI